MKDILGKSATNAAKSGNKRNGEPPALEHYLMWLEFYTLDIYTDNFTKITQ